MPRRGRRIRALSPPVLARVCAACIAWAWLSGDASALGRPDWAKPYLDAPPPQGTFIARSDEWVVVYGEIELGLSDSGRMEVRRRYILENVQPRDSEFSAIVAYDPGHFELTGLALNVQRSLLWHEINLKKGAFEATQKGGGRMVITGSEPIPSRRRVVWEYGLGDRIGFFHWARATVLDRWPITRLRVRLAPEAARAGWRIDLVDGGRGPEPPGFKRLDEANWEVTSIPARDRVPSDLVFQPAEDRLYPYFLASLSSEAAGSWKALAVELQAAWAKRSKEVDAAHVSARAAALAQGIEGALAKARGLASFVQREIRYDGFNEGGVDAWVPLAAEETLRSMKGDCKGKVMLLQALLSAVGIRSGPVFLRVDNAYFAWGDRAGTGQPNHVVLAVDLPPGAGNLASVLQEGPLKGWVLFDPTSEAVRFGASEAGLEGLPALCAEPGREGVFTIRTRVPSAACLSAKLECELDELQGMTCNLRAVDNGGSGPLAPLLGGTSAEAVREALTRTLAPVVNQLVLKQVRVDRPTEGDTDALGLEIDCLAPKAIQELSASRLLLNPLSLAATLKGLPPCLLPRASISEDDRVELADPWSRRWNSSGEESLFDVELLLKLPGGLRWAPGPPRQESFPWLSYREEWIAVGSDAWRCSVHLRIPRGEWPPEDRKVRLKVMDEILRHLHAPLVAVRGEAEKTSGIFGKGDFFLCALGVLCGSRVLLYGNSRNEP